jgi:phosphoribosylformylglycinamidine (FGAM) synthase PurS component
MKAKIKKFDAVKMMREIRDKLSEKYLANPEIEEMDLSAIRKKYGIKTREKVHA